MHLGNTEGRPVQLKTFAPLPVSMSPACPSCPQFAPIPMLLGHLMLESYKLRYLFCQVELFSCRHWQRELFRTFRLQHQVRTLRMTAFVKHAPAVML